MSLLNDELKELIQKAWKLEQEKDVVTSRLKEINSELEEIGFAAEPFFERESDNEMPLVELPELGQKVTLKLNSYYNVPALYKPELIAAMEKDPEAVALIKTDFHPSAFRAFVDDHINNTGRMPFEHGRCPSCSWQAIQLKFEDPACPNCRTMLNIVPVLSQYSKPSISFRTLRKK